MDNLEKQKIELKVAEEEFATAQFLGSFSKVQRYLLIVLVILLIPIYFIAEYSVSAYYMSNFNKTQITAHEAVFSNPLDIKIVQQDTLHIKDDGYSVYALVKNQNKDLSASGIPWSVRIFDDSGKVIYSARNDFYLLPGSQKYLIIPNIRLAAAPAKTEIVIGQANWVRRINLPNVILATKLNNFGNQVSPSGYIINGGFTNQSTFNIGQVIIKGILTDNTGHVIAVTQTFANTITPNETRDFQMYWPVQYAAQINGNPQIYVETNVLDPQNLN